MIRRRVRTHPDEQYQQERQRQTEVANHPPVSTARVVVVRLVAGRRRRIRLRGGRGSLSQHWDVLRLSEVVLKNRKPLPRGRAAPGESASSLRETCPDPI